MSNLIVNWTPGIYRNTALLILFTSILVLFILSRIFLFHVQVLGWSMYPALHHGDRLLAWRYFPRRWLRRGQIVVWKLPSKLYRTSDTEPIGPDLYVKRILGMPGDEVTAPVVRLPDPVDGKVLMDRAKQELKKWHIPEGHCFVKGDSPGFDSTVFGLLPLHALRGVILLKLPRRMKHGEEPCFIDSIPSQKEP